MEPSITPLQAAQNMVLYTEHLKDIAKPPKQKKELYFGVYRSRSFVTISNSTPWLERLKRYIQWLFGFISYKQEDVNKLAILSRKHWIPASEKDRLESAVETKIKQLEVAQILLSESQQSDEIHKSSLHAAEQMLKFNEELIQQKENAVETTQATLSLYTKTYESLKKQVDGKDKDILAKYKEIADLKLENGKLSQKVEEHKNNYRILDQRAQTVITKLQKDIETLKSQKSGAVKPPSK